MCRPNNTPMQYKHQELMNELNTFMIAVKLHLHPDKIITDADIHKRYPKPEIADIDAMHRLLNDVLKQDATPFVKY